MRSFLLIIDLVLPVSLLLLFELRCFCVFGVLCIVVLITNRFPHTDIVRPYFVSHSDDLAPGPHCSPPESEDVEI